MRRCVSVTVVSDDVLRRTSRIMGPGSASSQALAEIERRRALGEDAHVFRTGASFLVGPMPGSGADA